MTTRSRMAALSILLTLAATEAAHAAAHAIDAFPLVAQAIQAKHRLCYVGRQDILFLAVSEKSGTMRPGPPQIVTDVARDGRRLRLVYWQPSDARHRIVVDDGRWFRQWEPARQMTLVDRSQEETLAAAGRMLALLRRNYRCVLRGQARVNGLPCDEVAVRPRRIAGPARLLWIERRRHAILRTVEYDPAGRRRYVSWYESFHYVTRLPAASFSLPADAPTQPAPRRMRDVSSFGAAFAAAGITGRLPAWLPPGYVLIGCAVTGHRHPAALLRYGDGLKTLSVFEEAGRGAADIPTRQKILRAALAHYGQQVWLHDDSALRITILGDATLPDDLGKTMMESLAPGTEARLGRALARDFAGAGGQAAHLRQRGWGYEQIGALCLYLRAHPRRSEAASKDIRRGQSWQQIAAGLHTHPDRLEAEARRWIAAVMGRP